MIKRLGKPALALPVLLAASVAFPAAEDPGGSGGLQGWVEDTRGAPLAGAVISLFGRGVGAAGLVTLSDSSGRFFLPVLPAGSYTMRALRAGHVAAPARQITVLPNRELRFTVSLTPEEEAAAVAAAAAEKAGQAKAPAESTRENARELSWLLRHKRRSVLEEREAGPDGANAPVEAASLLPSLPLGATLEVVTHPDALGDGEEMFEGEAPALSLSALRLQGRLSDYGTWSLGGLLSESGTTSWRMAAEFVLEAGDHEIRAGSGYGTRMLRPELEGPARRDDRVGAVFIQDRWNVSEAVTTTIGGRFSHLGFLERVNYIDPMVAVELRPVATTTVRASASQRTLAPGGDLLTLSTLATAPSIALASMDDDLQAQRSLHVELAVEENLGRGTIVRAHTFYEGARNHLGNTFNAPGVHARSLRIFNTGRLASRGMGLMVARRFSGAVTGSMAYTYGHGWRRADGVTLPAGAEALRVLTFDEADFHDLVARLETVIEGSDTRLAALYRVNSLLPQGRDAGALTSSRFDVQLSQGLPFLGQLTRADWDLLLAVRNLYYDADEGAAVLDEVTVVNAPKRVLGGIAVRF